LSRALSARLLILSPSVICDKNEAEMSVKLRYLYRAFRYRWQVDPAELRFVCSQLNRGDVAVDIGCHKGAYTYWMRRRVGARGAVFAFEPQPRQVGYLRNVFSAMSYDNVALVPKAVSNICGQLTLNVPQGAGETHAASLETRHGKTASKISVEVTTIDAFFAEQDRSPNFLKIDVEGHELAVLQGAQRILELYKPALLIECEARHRPDGDVRPVFELLTSEGYEGSFFLKRHRYPLAAFQPAVHQRLGEKGELPPQYVNNFAFVPRR
jgi:FkbM family methyltransferase